MPRCCMCRLDKPETDFAFRYLKTGQRQAHCRVCHAAYRRQHYLRNREMYITREVARMAGYRIDNQILIFEYLSAHPCADCGESDQLVLDFDHRDPSTKRSEVARLACTKPWKIVSVEIAKCDIRCANCHRRRTAGQFSWALEKDATRPRAALPLAQVQALWADIASLTRQCSGCGVTEPLVEFSTKNAATGRRARRCHACVAQASQEHYRRNVAAYVAKSRRNRQRSRARNRQSRAVLLRSSGCVDCGEADPLVLEFDHRDGVQKIGTVARLMAVNAWAKVEAEIAKCDIRCSNCHRRRTALQFGWMKLSLQVATMSSTRE